MRNLQILYYFIIYIKGLIRTKKLIISVQEYDEVLEISQFIEVEVPYESEDLNRNYFIDDEESFIQFLNKRYLLQLLSKKCQDNIQGFSF